MFVNPKMVKEEATGEKSKGQESLKLHQRSEGAMERESRDEGKDLVCSREESRLITEGTSQR